MKFRTVDFGGAFFNRYSCVLCVLSDTWGLRCMMFIFCAKEADWGMMAFVGYLATWFSESYTCFRMHRVTRKQHACPSNTRRWFRQFLVTYIAWTRGGGVSGRNK